MIYKWTLIKQTMDLEKLVKILKLTESCNDNETLVAIRKANYFLAENKLSWEVIINQPIKPVNYSETKEMNLDQVFKFIFDNFHLWRRYDPTFVKSLHQIYVNNHILTDKQLYALLKIFDKIRKLKESHD